MLKLIPALDALTPWVQVIDCLIMLLCGIACLRSAKRNPNLVIKLLAISCFVSFVILLGFFLSSIQDAKPLIPLSTGARQAFYLIARLLAPFEFIFFGIVIYMIARRNCAEAASPP